MWLAVHRSAVLPAAGLLLAAACGSDGPTGPPGSTTRPLVFEYFIHPGTIQVGTTASIRAGVFVGPDLCWELGDVTLTQKRDTLVLAGVGVLRSWNRCGLALAYDSVQVALPPLAPGQYVLVADDLADTLVVSPTPVPATTPESFAAHGQVVIPLPLSACPSFECRFAGFDAVAGLLDNPPAVLPGATSGRATGDLGPGLLCFGQSPPVRGVHLRSFRPGSSYGDTRALVFDYFLHDGVLDASTPGELEAGALVGRDGCWTVLAAGLTLRNDSLLLSGVAFYAAPPDVGCTDATVHEVLRIAIPPLPAGQYIIAADTILADTLAVSSPAPRPAAKKFAAHGQLCPPIDTPPPRCAAPQFTCRHLGFNAVEGDLVNPQPVIRCSPAVLAGTIVDHVPCESIMRQRIHARGVRIDYRNHDPAVIRGGPGRTWRPNGSRTAL